eukprot:7375182-Prymnesium_polylepis.2
MTITLSLSLCVYCYAPCHHTACTATKTFLLATCTSVPQAVGIKSHACATIVQVRVKRVQREA